MPSTTLAQMEQSTQRHTRHAPVPCTTAAFTIVPLTHGLLTLLEPVEAASYPDSYCEGVPGYAKRLHAKPACPSFVCLQATCPASHNTDVAALAAAEDVGRLRAIGYAITCRMPRRMASLLLRDDGEDGKTSEDDADGCCGTVVDNHQPMPLTDAADHLPAPHVAPLAADTFYVHDVAVHPDFRGLGVAGALWKQMEETRAQLQLKRMSLVAVFGASSYWARHGFREVARKALPEETVRVLDDYGDHAVFMERED